MYNFIFLDKFVKKNYFYHFFQTDKPVTPGNTGLTLFLSGVTDEMRQTMRERLFEVTRQDITSVAQK